MSAQIAAIGLTATALGLLDAALVASGLAGARGSFQFVPMRLWIVAPVLWVLMAPRWRAWSCCPDAAMGRDRSVGRARRSLPRDPLRAARALLFGALAAVVVLLAVLRQWILRWMASRAARSRGVFGTVIASGASRRAPSP